MTTKQLEDSGFRKPLKKFRAGRFQISLWSFRRLMSSGSTESAAYAEKWMDVERACIQFSTLNRLSGHFENQAIWCPFDDLRNLAQVVDQLNGEEESSPPFSEDEEARKPAGDKGTDSARGGRR